MTDSQARVTGQNILTWVQIVAIVAAGAWAVYAFIYTEITKPQSAPVNISIELSLHKVGLGKNDSGKSLLGIEMRVSAINPSSREVFLLPSIWYATGYALSREETTSDEFRKYVDNFEKERANEFGKHYAAHFDEDGYMVAVGGLVENVSLKPNEKVSRTLVFYVPRGRYDLVSVRTIVPTAVRPEELVLKYKVNKDGSDIETAIYRKPSEKRDPKRGNAASELLVDYGQEIPAGIRKEYELESARSEAELSLWE